MGPFGGWIPHISLQIRVLTGGRKCPVYKERDRGFYWSPYGGLERTLGLAVRTWASMLALPWPPVCP